MAHVRMKSIVANTLLVLGTLFLCAAASEIFLRVFFPAHVTPDERLGWIAHPGRGWDERGWRNPTAPEKADIVALGDSMTMGDPTDKVASEDSWPAQLGRMSSTSVYQMALGGYGPVQYDALAEDALRLRPKVVVVGFYLGNDLYDVYRMVYEKKYWKELRDPAFTPHVKSTSTPTDDFFVAWSGVVPGTQEARITATVAYLSAHSRLFALLKEGIWDRVEASGDKEKEMSERFGRMERFTAEHPEIAYIYPNEPIKTILNSQYRLDTVNIDDANTKEAWRIAKERFSDLQKKLADAEARLVVAIIPTKESVYETMMNERGERFPEAFKGLGVPESKLRSAVIGFCAEARIECVDLLPPLATALASGTPVYWDDIDGHPTPAGYRVIAGAIGSVL
jgi:hypothetical protein